MMKIQEIYNLAIQMGMSVGPRSKKDYLEKMQDAKKRYEKLEKCEQQFFDQEKFLNPFADTRILYGNPNQQVKKALVGIDIELSELLIVKELERQGIKIDLAIAHHPKGKALSGINEVLELQEDIITSEAGVPINIVEKLMEPRIKEVSRLVAPINKERPVDAARLLNIPFMCMHTVADNHVHSYLTQYLAKRKNLKYVQDIIFALREIEEYRLAALHNDGPKVFAGHKHSKAGKIAVTGMTGGMEGAEKIYKQLSLAGIGTIIEMHISETRRKCAEKYHLNVIVAGHMASDSIGMNLIMDKIEKKGVEIIPCSGFIRVKR